jgi:hypothetical protein
MLRHQLAVAERQRENGGIVERLRFHQRWRVARSWSAVRECARLLMYLGD